MLVIIYNFHSCVCSKLFEPRNTEKAGSLDTLTSNTCEIIELAVYPREKVGYILRHVFTRTQYDPWGTLCTLKEQG